MKSKYEHYSVEARWLGAATPGKYLVSTTTSAVKFNTKMEPGAMEAVSEQQQQQRLQYMMRA